MTPNVAEETRRTTARLTPAEREEMIIKSMPIVYAIAKRMIGTLSAEASFDDLVSAGTVGLINAIDNFSPSYETQISTYAAYRIRGAMIDSVRAADWMPRRQRAHIKKIQRAVLAAQQKHKKLDVSEEEIALELGIAVTEYRETLASLPVTRVVSIDATDQDGLSSLELLSEPESELPSAVLERTELHNLLQGAIDHLPDQERDILNLYYEEGLSPQEIAQVTALPIKRIYQLKAQAILRLRAGLNRRLLRRPVK